jgi:hypothetical protein
MIDSMSFRLPDFPGEEHRVRCFNHIVNLIGKSLLKLFEVPKKSRTSDDAALDTAEEALRNLGEDIEIEDLRTQLDTYANVGSLETDDPNDIYDEIGTMTETEAAEFRESVLPIRRALVKVSSLILDQAATNDLLTDT